MNLAGCPLCADSLNRLDVACALVDQAIRGADLTQVPQLTAAVTAIVSVLGVEVEVDEIPGSPSQVPRLAAALDQAKAGCAAAIRAGGPCASGG